MKAVLWILLAVLRHAVAQLNCLGSVAAVRILFAADSYFFAGFKVIQGAFRHLGYLG